MFSMYKFLFTAPSRYSDPGKRFFRSFQYRKEAAKSSLFRKKLMYFDAELLIDVIRAVIVRAEVVCPVFLTVDLIADRVVEAL